ncbi:hypothetical protein BDQ17DRAFT_1541640 [Cyathus striatus]|nr:hypothetical protein BDQ17DRAFT_1541640 [Cyathus striatus]
MLKTRIPEARLLKEEGDRLGKTVDGLLGSIAAYEAALEIIPSQYASLSLEDEKFRQECAALYDQSCSKLLNPSTMPFEALTVLARGHGIDIPIKDMDAYRKSLLMHPKMAAGISPPMRLLYIPLSEAEPLQSVVIVNSQHYPHEMGRLLGCQSIGKATLHSEDQAARAHGKSRGVGVGQLHKTYEAWMDQSSATQHPLNRRASALLCRPGTRGPVLVSKSISLRSAPDPPGVLEEILSWDAVTEEELRSDAFRNLRLEWIGLNRESGMEPDQGIEISVRSTWHN